MVSLNVIDAAANLAQAFLLQYEATGDDRYLTAFASLSTQMGRRVSKPAV